jgi:hypothetical protein
MGELKTGADLQFLLDFTATSRPLSTRHFLQWNYKFGHKTSHSGHFNQIILHTYILWNQCVCPSSNWVYSISIRLYFSTLMRWVNCCNLEIFKKQNYIHSILLPSYILPAHIHKITMKVKLMKNGGGGGVCMIWLWHHTKIASAPPELAEFDNRWGLWWRVERMETGRGCCGE